MLGKAKGISRLFNRVFESAIFRESQPVSSFVAADDTSDNESITSWESIPQDDMNLSSDGLSTVYSQSVDEIVARPMSDHEIQSGILSLRERPDLFYRFLPNQASTDRIEHIFEGVRAVLSDQHLIASTVNLINGANPLSAIATPLPINIENAEVFQTFDDLRTKLLCTICQDLLAAPVALNCSHTFCGACYQTLKDSCISSDVEVMPNCPKHHKPITSANYVRAMDDFICQEVSKMPESRDKANWQSRRNNYFNPSATTNPGGKKKAAPTAEGFDRFPNEIIVPIAVLSAIVIILVCIARYRAK